MNLIDGDKDVARAVAATPIGGTTAVKDIVASKVEVGRGEFERGLDYIVDRGTFSHKTYSDSVQPTINAMTKVCTGNRTSLIYAHHHVKLSTHSHTCMCICRQ